MISSAEGAGKEKDRMHLLHQALTAASQCVMKAGRFYTVNGLIFIKKKVRCSYGVGAPERHDEHFSTVHA